MTAATPPSGSDRGDREDVGHRPSGVLIRLLSTLIAGPLGPLVAGLFRLWSRFRLGIRLGPSLGFPSDFGSLHMPELRNALPSMPPPRDLIAEEIGGTPWESGPTEELQLANVWATALQTEMLRHGERYAQRGLVLTSYGFARVEGRIQLSVIQYLKPQAAFRARKPEPVHLDGWTFPVIIRPWLSRHHGPRSGFDGTCWVKWKDKDGRQYPAILTARHALVPEGASIGAEVRVDVARPTPAGHLRYESAIMDAAVVEVDEQVWGSKESVYLSTVVGYKPVRFVTGSRNVEAAVVEHTGFPGATIMAQPGQEPPSAVQFFFDRALEKGDSGCLVVDLEFEFVGLEPRPYLLYLGKQNHRWGGIAGYGLLLEQSRIVWDLEFFR